MSFFCHVLRLFVAIISQVYAGYAQIVNGKSVFLYLTEDTLIFNFIG